MRIMDWSSDVCSSDLLIAEHGFTIVAVEADWPDAASIDRYVRHRSARPDGEPTFQRFPTWMWRNADVDAFVGWLREHNASVRPERRAGFYGFDPYHLNGSLRAGIDHLGTGRAPCEGEGGRSGEITGG